MTRILPRALASAAVVTLFALGLSAPASAAPAVTYVIEADLSSVNVSAAYTKWDSFTGSPAAALPSTGTKWALDIENKPLGSTDITADGLVLAVEAPIVAPAVTPAPQKVRYQYYIGTGGYSAIDAQAPTLDDLLAAPLSWDLGLLSGVRTTYGPVFQVQLQKALPGGAGYARVTVQTVWNPADGTIDLQNGLWFANTNIYAAGYPAGATTYAPTGDTILNRAGSGPGVQAQVLSDNFGDFEVVSFGPNLGRDYVYSFAFQNLTVLGQTFVFVEQLPAVPAPSTPPSTGGGGGGTGGGPTGPTSTFGAGLGTTTIADTEDELDDEQLPTFALPEETTVPSTGDEPADEGTTAAPASEGDGFPTWLLILGIGFLVLVLAIILWILRRRFV